MRIFIISDLHANLEALSALPRDYDELWVLGDLVNYGPNPAEIIDFVRSHASMIIRGNHDHSVGFGAECRCAPRFRAMAEATRDYTSSVLSAADKQFLRDLSTCARRQVDGQAFFLCHATPSDFLYEYRPPGSPLWERDEGAGAGAHRPWLRRAPRTPGLRRTRHRRGDLPGTATSRAQRRDPAQPYQPAAGMDEAGARTRHQVEPRCFDQG